MNPAAAELVAADHGVIGKKGAVFDVRERGDHHGGGNLHVLANARAQSAQPPRGQLRGIEREELRAGLIHEALDGPQAPAGGRAHRVHAG